MFSLDLNMAVHFIVPILGGNCFRGVGHERRMSYIVLGLYEARLELFSLN